MGIFDWLFGKSSDDWSPTIRWEMSEYGNLTTIIEGYRVTVFEQDYGWAYCIAELDKDDPYFSDRFGSMEEAKKAALDEFG